MGQVNPVASTPSAAIDNQPLTLPAAEAVSINDVLQLSGGTGKVYRANPALGALLNKTDASPSPLAANTNTTTSSVTSAGDSSRGVVLGSGNAAIVAFNVNSTAEVRIHDQFGKLVGTNLLAEVTTPSVFLRVLKIDAVSFAVVYRLGTGSAPVLKIFSNAGVLLNSYTLAKPASIDTWGSCGPGSYNDAIVTADGYLVLTARDSGNYLSLASYTLAGALVGYTAALSGNYSPWTYLFAGAGSGKIWLTYFNASQGYVYAAVWGYTTSGSSALLCNLSPLQNIGITNGSYYPPHAVLPNGNIALVSYTGVSYGILIFTPTGSLVATQYFQTFSGSNPQSITATALADGTIMYGVQYSTSFYFARLSADGATLTQGPVTQNSAFLQNNGGGQSPITIRQTDDGIQAVIVDTRLISSTNAYVISILNMGANYPNSGTLGSVSNIELLYQVSHNIGSVLAFGSTLLISYSRVVSSTYSWATQFFWTRAGSIIGSALSAASAGAAVSVATKGGFPNLAADQNFPGILQGDPRTAAVPGPRHSWIGRTLILLGLT